jgi:hypothetical protein
MTALRGAAILIAVLGVVDPSVTASRRQKPVVAIVDTTPGTDLANRVARELGESFAIVRGPFFGASAVVAVGDRLPASADAFAGPAFAVTPPDESAVAIESLQVPVRAQFQARVPVTAVARVRRASGRNVELTLEQSGVVLDRATRKVSADDERMQVPLAFVPTANGLTHFRVTASIEGVPAVRHADAAVDVRDDRWAVLVFDGRPSWNSTFVIRALESDPRFAVTTRIVTSRNVTADTGRPPQAFDVSSLVGYDAVVIGAPETLTERDVSGLEAYLRRRGGAVVLLLDQRAGGPYDRLTTAIEWGATAGATAIPVDAAASAAAQLQATEIAWPVRLPPGAVTVAATGVTPAARSTASTPDPTARRPVIWRAPAGAGHVVVSGALDAWRFRSTSAEGFDRFWRTVVADAAAASAAPIDVRLDDAVLSPGETTSVRVTLREASLAEIVEGRSIAATVAAVIEGPAGERQALRLWPDGGIGRFAGTLVAPAAAGAYRVAVSNAGTRAEANLIVASGAARPASSEPDLLEAWARSRGGQVVPIGRVREVLAGLERLLPPDPQRARWYPMRSPWWIVPFAAALGAEWWWRRRRGLS